ncbi:unnamed protein product [Adineta steineri]|uniref:AMP-dependent synthetase/ligase domain-containing protein n=1 Tax=Adineta steineri TaxID=433720 RepID=A0A819W751_9BILA|nr:unnamed protein product [Adineta steineri]
MSCCTDNWSTCLHTKLMSNMEKYAQKISIELDEQSLSYAETGYYVQRLALALLDTDLFHRHEIIYQMVTRSIELPLGMFAIFAVGRIYYGLNPDDSNLRLSSLIHDTATTQCSTHDNTIDQVSYPSTALILVHQMTHERAQNLLTNKVVQLEPVNMSSIMSSMNTEETDALTDDDLARLSNVDVIKTSSAFLNCTSGSTGKPKIVEHTHGSLTYFLHSMNEAYQFRSTDNILQLASCQWVNHVWEVTFSLCFGSTLVLLHPGGQLDVDYLLQIMMKKEIGALASLPSTARLLAEHAATKSNRNVSCFASLRAYIIGGSIVAKHHIMPLLRVVEHQQPLPRIMIALGTAETSGIVHHVMNWNLLQISKDWDTLPIGKSLPGRQCFLRDTNGQQRITMHDIVGELCVVAGNEYKLFIS